MEPPDKPRRRPGAELAILQTKPKKGNYRENLAHAAEAFRQLGADRPPDLVVLPEAAFTGYFLEGAVYELALEAETFAADLSGAWFEANPGVSVDLVAGFFEKRDGTYYNAAMYLALENGGARIAHVHRKMFLPTYGVFDEARFLTRGRRLQTFATRFGTVAMLICEDVWHSIVPTVAALKGARILIVASAAPGRGIDEGNELSSITRWREILQAVAAEHGVYVAYANLAGFEGGKGFSGSSCVVDPWGRVLVQGPNVGECIVRARLDPAEIDRARAAFPLLWDLEAVLPDLLLDGELPLPRGIDDVSGR